jgi:hypothetical protein
MQAAGIAAMLPGFQMAIDLLEERVADLRSQLAGLQGLGVPTVKMHRKSLPHPKKRKGSNGWSANPEERKADMQRRMAKRKPATHPRDKRHPQHDKWRETMRKAQLKRWGKMTVAEKKATQDKMQAGKAA